MFATGVLCVRLSGRGVAMGRLWSCCALCVAVTALNSCTSDDSTPASPTGSVVGSSTTPASTIPGSTTIGPYEAPTDDPQAAARLAASLAATSSPDERERAVSEALARAGIATSTLDGQLLQPVGGPSSAITVAQLQLHNLVPNGDGVLASSLDAVTPAFTKLPPPSILLASYVAAADTFGAELARELMAGVDLTRPADVVYPTLVLALFEGELTLGSGSEPTSAGLRSGFNAPSGFCVELKSFLTGTVDALATAVDSIIANVPVLGWFVEALSYAVDVLLYPLEALAELVKDALFINELTAAAGIIGTVIMMASTLQPWDANLEASPSSMHYALEGDAATSGAFELHLTANSDPLADVRPCADLAGISLPAADTSDGTAVTWELDDDFATHLVETQRDGAASGGVAALRYETGTESAWAHSNGEEQSAIVNVSVTADRAVVELIGKLYDELFDGSQVALLIKRLLDSWIDDADAAVNKLLGLAVGTRSSATTVSWHDMPSMRFDVSWDPTYENGYRVWSWSGTSCDGPEGPWFMTLSVNGTAPPLENASGTGDTSFTIDSGAAHFSESFPVFGIPGGAQTFSYETDVTLDASQSILTFTTTEAVGGFSTGTAVVGTATIIPGPACP